MGSRFNADRKANRTPIHSMARDRIGGVVVGEDSLLSAQRRLVAALALRHGMPTVCGYKNLAEAGCLISYGEDSADAFRRAAGLVHKVLQG